MPVFLRCLALVCLTLLFAAGFLRADAPPEIRGLWVDTWGSGFRSASEIDQLIANAQRGNLNAIFPQVRRRGDGFYNSTIEPKNPSISPANFDPLAYLIQKARAANPPIEVHAWIITYPLGSGHGNPDHILNKHPDWLMSSASGGTLISNEYWADPAHPGVQQHVTDVALDLISRYDIDGFHFDYIRYPSPQWGYNSLSVARFNHRFGRSGNPAANDPQWLQFRRDAVTQLVRRVYLEGIAANPAIKISTATIGQGGGITTTAQWPNSTPYSARLQDWRAWMEEGIVDLNIPMLYYDQQGDWAHGWSNWNVFAKNHKYNRHLAIGPAWYMNTISGSLAQIAETRQPTTTGNRAEGMVGYNYATTNNQGIPRSTFFNALSGSGGPFSEPAPIPTMPWKTNPTRGHAKGIVTSDTTLAPVDHATVRFTGPETRTVFTDGNGFYGAVDLAPGTYTVTATLPNAPYDPASAQITVVPGSVATADLVLEFAPAAEIVLDDADAELFGSWTSASNPAQFGSGYRVAWPVNPSGAPTATATFRPTISIPGTYEIHVWYVHGGNRSPDAPHTIRHSNGQMLIPVDQRTGGGGWQLLATGVHFAAGNDGFVRIGNNANGNAVIADAVRFSLIDADPDPADFFEEPVVHAGSAQAIVTWETVGNAVVHAEYGITRLDTLATSETATETTEHSVTIGDLTPDTIYQLRLHARSGSATWTSNWHSFRTDESIEIIVDNADPAPRVAFSPPSAWSTGAFGTFYGENYHRSFAGSVGATATFRPDLPAEGIYDVYTWYTAGDTWGDSIPHRIRHADGEITVPVNQRTDGGSWRLLADGLRFLAGTGGFVEITNNGSGVTIADAQRWVRRDSPPRHTLASQTDGNGQISRAPSAADYAHGATVELAAAPAPGWVFSHWTGDIESTENPASIHLYRDREVTAVFHRLFELTTGASGEGTVSVDGGGSSFPAETEVAVLATAAPGWTFLGWDGHLPSDENPALVWMDGDKNLTANFGFSYESWSEITFTQEQLADPAVSAPAADPFGSGIPNLVHYAFGTNPREPDFRRLPAVSSESDSLLLHFHRLRFPAGIEYSVEISTDLKTWEPAADLFAETAAVPNSDGKTEKVTLAAALSGASRTFVRITISQP